MLTPPAHPPVGMLLVLDVQVFQGGHEGLSLKAPGRSRGDGGVADGALGADGDDVAPERRAQVPRLVSGLGYAAHVEAPAEINAVQDLRGRGGGEAVRIDQALLGCTAQNDCSGCRYNKSDRRNNSKR